MANVPSNPLQLLSGAGRAPIGFYVYWINQFDVRVGIGFCRGKKGPKNFKVWEIQY